MKSLYVLLLMLLCLMAHTAFSLEAEEAVPKVNEEEQLIPSEKEEEEEGKKAVEVKTVSETVKEAVLEKPKEDVVPTDTKNEDETAERIKTIIEEIKLKKEKKEKKEKKDDDDDSDSDDDNDEEKKRKKAEKKLRKEKLKKEKRLKKMNEKKVEKKEDKKEEVKKEEEKKEDKKEEVKEDKKEEEKKEDKKEEEVKKEENKKDKDEKKDKEDKKKGKKDEKKKNDRSFQLTSNRLFRDLVFGTEYVWVVNFINPDDEASNAFEPIYSEISRSLVGIVPAGVVNCKRTPGLCERFSVKKYPYILLFPSEPEAVEDKIVKTPIEYEGEYTKEAIIAECEKNIPDRISHIDDEENPNRLSKFLAEETPLTEDRSYIPHKFLIVTSPNEGPSKTLTTMALNFHHMIDFAEIRNPSDATLAKFNLKREELPVMIIKLSPKFNKGVDESVRFTGKSSQDLVDFLTPYSEAVKSGLLSNEKEEL